MKNEGNSNGGDHVQGRVYRGKRWSIDKQKYESGKFFNLALFEIDQRGEPVQVGEITLKSGKKAPKFKIAKVFRVAESSLLKVAAGDSKSCNIYYSDRR